MGNSKGAFLIYIRYILLTPGKSRRVFFKNVWERKRVWERKSVGRSECRGSVDKVFQGRVGGGMWGTLLSKDFLTDIEGWVQNLWHSLTLHISFHRKIIMIGNIY